MSLRILYSQAARSDLNQIWLYSAEHRGEDRADAYVASIRDALLLFARNPRLARSAHDIREGLMKYAAGSHILYCRFGDHTISVIRILHSRMDAGRHL